MKKPEPKLVSPPRAVRPPEIGNEDVAADWIARRNGGGLTEAEQVKLRTWLSADSLHAQAFAEMEASWQLLNEPRGAGQAEILWERTAKQKNRVKTYGVVTASLAAAAAILLAFLPLDRGRSLPEASSPVVAVRPDLRTLPDGSTVELNIGAEIAVNFTAEKRGVRLVRGEALFAVTKNAARPFVVTAGAVEVRAVGTAFAVRHAAEHINVLVTEGQVAVEHLGKTGFVGSGPEGKPAPVYLGVGKQVDVPVRLDDTVSLAVKGVSADELTAALAWRDKRVEFTDMPLAEAVKLFNRGNRVQLAIADSALVARVITGVFWDDDPEGFVRLLETGFNIKAERSVDVITLRGK